MLARLAIEKPRDLPCVTRIEGLAPWQLDLFGAELAEVIRASLREFERDGLPRRTRRGWGRGRG